MQFPYAYTRATTPPLLYRRSQSTAAPSSAGPRDIQGLQLPSYSNSSSAPPPRPAPYASLSYVTNPFPQSGSAAPPRPSIVEPGIYPMRGTAAGSAAMPWSCGAQRDSGRLVSLDGEDAALLAEEAALKAKLTELRAERQMCDDEQQHLSQGWAMLLEREQRFHTDPIPDYSMETMECEQRCLMVHEQVKHAEAHLAAIREQLAPFDPLLEERDRLRAEIQALIARFKELEQRRLACLRRAGLFFDVESTRALESQRAARMVDEQLSRLRQCPALRPYANTAEMNAMVKSASERKNVSFAEEKSFVMDWSSNPGSIERDDRGGMTSSSADFSANTLDPWRGTAAMAQAQNSICIGLDDGDDADGGITGVGGTSTVVSLNHPSAASAPFAKRHRVERSAA